MKQSLYWLILLAGLMAGQVTLSENDEDLETVRAGVQQIGKQFNPRVLAATRDLYLPLQKQASPPAAKASAPERRRSASFQQTALYR